MPGRSTRSLDRMRKSVNESSINAHFRREAIWPAILFGVLLGVPAVMALVGPWILERLR